MFSKKLNMDIVEKDPETYYVIKDPDQPPYRITITKESAIKSILPYADAYLNQKLGLVKDPIGRHDSHNDYYSPISYDGKTFMLYKLIRGNLKQFNSLTLDSLLDQFEKPTPMSKDWSTYYPEKTIDVYKNYKTGDLFKDLKNLCTYPVFLTDDEDRIDDITALQQAYLENKTDYGLSIDYYETKDGFSFEPIINGEPLTKESFEATVTKNSVIELDNINCHLNRTKQYILEKLKDIPTKQGDLS